MSDQIESGLASIVSFDFPEFTKGEVWLVGSGPGDPGLLTLLALQAIQLADVIIYDALVDDRILELAQNKTRKQSAELIFAGKRGGRPSIKQKDISEMIVKLAQQQKRVLRLKGGDPFVFGRGGEEVLALADAKINFRIVPGITAGIGGLAYAGIPVTHRDINHAVTFITGHSMTGDTPKTLDWNAIAKGAPVLVLYMAIKHMKEIASLLMEAGRAPDEAVAFICQASTPNQKVEITCLSQAGEVAQTLEPPAIVVVGPNVAFRKVMAWF